MNIGGIIGLLIAGFGGYKLMESLKEKDKPKTKVIADSVKTPENKEIPVLDLIGSYSASLANPLHSGDKIKKLLFIINLRNKFSEIIKVNNPIFNLYDKNGLLVFSQNILPFDISIKNFINEIVVDIPIKLEWYTIKILGNVNNENTLIFQDHN